MRIISIRCVCLVHAVSRHVTDWTRWRSLVSTEVTVRVVTCPTLRGQWSVWLYESLLNLRLPVWRFVSVQVTVSMYKRGAQGWLGKPLIATATIPSSTRVIFRIRGETTDAKIPAGSIRSITLSIWSASLIRRNFFLILLRFCNSSRWSSSLLARTKL